MDAVTPDPRRWKALAVLGIACLMVALVDGFNLAFWVAAAFAAGAIVATVLALRGQDLAAAEPAHAAEV
jgi:hypothetical protein